MPEEGKESAYSQITREQGEVRLDTSSLNQFEIDLTTYFYHLKEQVCSGWDAFDQSSLSALGNPEGDHRDGKWSRTQKHSSGWLDSGGFKQTAGEFRPKKTMTTIMPPVYALFLGSEAKVEGFNRPNRQSD